MAQTEQSPRLENALTELEQLVEHLSDNTLSLEESLQLFEKGVKLSKTCQSKLQQAEQKIQQLSKTQQLTDYKKED